MSDNNLLTEKPALTLAAAKKIIAAAEAEALKHAWPVVIAVVDDGGHLLCLERLDNTQFGSVEIAIQKARAAMAFKRPTKVWEELLTTGQHRVLGLPGVLPSEGGLPLIWKDQIVGAIGVSGVKSSEDGQIARVGATVLV
ncbi:MAG: GlcG/HbpS family heme-binding protein [Sulfuricaulis sp.]